jgi:hypothetical protein
MKTPLCILLLLTCLLPGIAQRLSPAFGTLTDSEKAMTSFEADPEAQAVVLFDVGDSYFFDAENGYNIRFTRMKRIKVLARAGIEEASTVSIPFYVESPSKTEKVVSIEAFTYNLKDGLVFKKALDPSTVFEEKVNTFNRVKKFAFPDVQEGSIVEYKYVLETPFQFNLPDWTFQSKIPTLYSEYTVRMIPFYEYEFIAQGISKFDYQNSAVSSKKRTWGTVTENLGATTGTGIQFSDMVHTYAMKNIPAFRDETLITSIDDYIMKMDFQLSKFNRPTGGSETIITTWPELTKALLDHDRFGKYMNACSRLSKRILEKELVLAPDMSEEKKCESILEYVRSNFQWDNYSSYFASKSAKEFVEQKSGNITDINLFLLSLLKSAGINAEPVILSTRSHGKIRANYPFGHYFNATLVLINGQRSFLMDGSERQLAYDRIPIRCINEKGLVVSEKDVKWVNLEPRVPSIDEKQMTIKIDPDQAVATISGKISSTEYKAYEYKQAYENDSTEFKKYLLDNSQIKAHGIQFFSYDKPKLPYVMVFKGTTSLERIGNKIVIQPLLNFPLKENPLHQASRTYPVDFIFPQNSKTKSSVSIPEGYKVEALPEPIMMDNEMAQIVLAYTINGNDLEIQADYVLKKSTYSSAEYSKLKFYLAMIVKGFNAPIVLNKL